jgi:glycerate-2-kinase
VSVRESQSVRSQFSQICRARASAPCQYEQAVKAFEPYDAIKEENPEARATGRALIAEGQAAGPKRRTFVFVNNRLEANAISTVAAMPEPG